MDRWTGRALPPAAVTLTAGAKARGPQGHVEPPPGPERAHENTLPCALGRVVSGSPDLAVPADAVGADPAPAGPRFPTTRCPGCRRGCTDTPEGPPAGMFRAGETLARRLDRTRQIPLSVTLGPARK